MTSIVGVTWFTVTRSSVTWYNDDVNGRRRGSGVVGVREAKVVKARDGPRDTYHVTTIT